MYDPKIDCYCLALDVDGHFVHGNNAIVTRVTALRCIHVTIIMQSHWPKPPDCVSIAISRAQYTIQLVWNWILREISDNMVYDLLVCGYP